MGAVIRIGKISSIDYTNGCADVYFDDEESVVKTALPFSSSEYLLPTVGESVVVAFQTKGNQGYILGSFFSASNKPEHAGKGSYFKRFSEKAYIHYDAETETLKIAAPRIIIRETETGEKE